MQTIQRVSLSIFLLLLFSLQFSCTAERQANQATNQSDRAKTQVHGHGGSFKGCAACVAINKSNAPVETNIHSVRLSKEYETAFKDNHAISSPNHFKSPILNLLKRLNSVADITRVNTIVVAGCDTIILKNGDKIGAKISEIGISEIKYKKCDYTDGPTYTMRKSDVFMVKYPNGSSEIFADSRAGEKPKDPENNTPEKNELTNSEKYVKGQIDASQNHLSGAWFLAGLFLALIGVLIAALSNPSPWSGDSELSGDLAYREGYKKEARRMNTSSAATGWFAWLIILLLILL